MRRGKRLWIGDVRRYIGKRSIVKVSFNFHNLCCNRAKPIYARPSIFFRLFLVSPTSLSQHPPYHGARFGMNFHVVPNLLNLSCKDLESADLRISSAAATNVVALSDIITLGIDFLPMNLRKATMNDFSVKSGTISR